MLTSLALIILVGVFLGHLAVMIKMPPLLGMIITGIIIGPFGCNLIDPKLISIANELRTIALIIILLRAGLALDISDLRRIGRPAFLMCWIPATFELLAMTLLAPPLLGVSYLDGAIMGAILGAVSPAIIIPKMLHIMQEDYGVKKGIPQLLMAGASVDDIFVIVIFMALLEFSQHHHVSKMTFINMPISVVTAILVGIALGQLLIYLFKRYHMRDSLKIVIILGCSFLLQGMEPYIRLIGPFSALLAIITIGIVIQHNYNILAIRLSEKYSRSWVFAEIILFVLIGSVVDLHHMVSAFRIVIAILLALAVRLIGVLFALIKTELTVKERLFCAIASIPKATVQAAIGGIPLAYGLSSGQEIISVAVLSILLTAPLGAFLIDYSYSKLLCRDRDQSSAVS